jgi:PAS domain S-box-containing protein
MKDEKKTKRQLINELQEMRQRVAELETLDTESSFTEELIRHAQDFAEGIVQTVREPLMILDSDLRVISANLSFYRNFQVSPEETENQFIFELGNHQWDIPRLRELLEEILSKDTHFNDFEVSHNFLTVGHRTMLLNARQIFQEGIGTSNILLAIEDITDRKRAEKVMRLAQEKMEQQLEIARVIQESFLPTYLPGDDDPRFSIAAVNHPAAVVGGDYYDVIPLGHDRLGLVLCDVSGKGVPGAIYMARLVSDFRLLVDPHEGTPAETLTELNRILLERISC